jgi:Lysine methyltransferase
LLKHDAKADVLQRNAFGRSALTEGFTSQNTSVINSLLEHDSATEEKLMKAPPSSVKEGDEEEMGDTESSTTPRDGVTHEFIFLDTPLQVRELPIARGDEESILGQSNPSDDTTGLGIWAASLVMAQWMAHLCQKEDKFRPSSSSSKTTILELGAGCGVPALTIAKMAKPASLCYRL